MQDCQLDDELIGKKHIRALIEKTEYLSIYRPVASFLLKMYATKENFVESNSDITPSAQLSGMTASYYAGKADDEDPLPCLKL